MSKFKDLKDELQLLEKRIALIKHTCPTYGEKKLSILKREKDNILNMLFNLTLTNEDTE